MAIETGFYLPPVAQLGLGFQRTSQGMDTDESTALPSMPTLIFHKCQGNVEMIDPSVLLLTICGYSFIWSSIE